MRTLASALQTAQQALNRAPETQLIIRDVFLRFSNVTTGAYSSDFPNLLDANGIPQCQFDAGVEGGKIYRAWSAATTTVRAHECDDPTSAAEWASAGTEDVEDYLVNGKHRMSVYGNHLFYAANGTIRHVDIPGVTPVVFKSSAYTVDTDCVALAAVSDSVVYMAQYHEAGDLKYLTLHRVTSSAITDCPITIVVDSDYNEASLTWFDAVTLGSKDVLVVNERAYGHPVIVFYEDGVWSDPRPILPMDVVDNYSYLRIAGMTVQQDAGSEDVIWATGRLGRKGSTGLHAQSADIVLRSKDGVHWTSDRYCYVCSDNMRGRFLVTGSKVYYVNGATIKHADQTWLMGGDPSGLKWTISDDVLSWRYTQPTPGAPCTGDTAIANHDGDYDPLESGGRSGIWPGYWVWRYAGYNGNQVLLSTEGIDTVSPAYQSGDRRFSIATRDIALRLMVDWASDQDWQWLSESKLADACADMSYLYSIGSATIEVRAPNDVELTGSVDQTAPLEGSNGLEFQAYNRPGIFLTTTPVAARTFTVAARFGFPNASNAFYYRPTDNISVDSNQGSLAYSTNQFTDSGQDFTDYEHLYGTGARYMIYITNSDGTISWGYFSVDSATQISVCQDLALSSSGWNGTSPSGKTPSSYYISVVPTMQKLPYGAGVVGCVDDQYNLVAAFFNVADKSLDLYWRSGDEDDSHWFLLDKDTSLGSFTPSSSEIYEVELRRIGNELQAKFKRFTSGATAPSDEATLTYDWDIGERMVSDDDDRCSVGVLCYLRSGESRIQALNEGSSHVARFIQEWPEPPNGYESHDPWDDSNYAEYAYAIPNGYADFHSAIADHMRVEDETEIQPYLRTESDYRSLCYTAYDKIVNGSKWLEGNDTCDPPSGTTWDDSGSGYGWVLVLISGPGSENNVSVQITDASVDHLGSGRDRFEIAIDQEDWDAIVTGSTKFMLLPGFYAYRPGWDTGEAVPHSAGTLMRQRVDDDQVLIKEVRAFDHEHDLSIENIIQDIATKAGVLDFEFGKSVNATPFSGEDNPTGAVWLQDVDSVDLQQRDFDLTITLPNVAQSGDELIILARASSKLSSAPTNGNLSTFYGVKLSYSYDGSDWTFAAYQTTDAGATAANWVMVDQETFGEAAGGAEIRVVGHGDFFSMYVNSRLFKTFHVGPIFGLTSDGYDSNFDLPGYIGIWRQGTTDWTGLTVTQPELWTWVDGIILDQRMNAIAGLERVIKERRIKFMGRADGTLKVSLFTSRDTVQAIGDQIYQDQAGPTDRIPTHIRAVGAEISEYIDHTAAADWGMTFASVQCPSLEEEEAFKEAQRVTEDAVSRARGRSLVQAARVDWEPEDKVQINYTPDDGGPTVNAYYIVHGIVFSYRPADLSAAATVRKV